jgi:hypothetical protein
LVDSGQIIRLLKSAAKNRGIKNPARQTRQLLENQAAGLDWLQRTWFTLTEALEL